MGGMFQNMLTGIVIPVLTRDPLPPLRCGDCGSSPQ